MNLTTTGYIAREVLRLAEGMAVSGRVTVPAPREFDSDGRWLDAYSRDILEPALRQVTGKPLEGPPAAANWSAVESNGRRVLVVREPAGTMTIHLGSAKGRAA